MLRNAILIWLRSIQRGKFVFALNFISLVVGLTSSLIILIYVLNEHSFDDFHPDSANIYRLTTVFGRDGKETHYALNEGKWDISLESDVSGVVASTAILPADEAVFVNDEKMFPAARGFYTDDDFLQVFGFQLRHGDRASCLNESNAIIVTKTLAVKLFGSTDIIGKAIGQKTSQGVENYVVTGVLEDVPLNSSLRFDYIAKGSGEWWEEQFKGDQGNTMHIFFRTATAETLPVLQAKIDRAFAIKVDKSRNISYTTPVQSLPQLHFNATAEFEIVEGGNKNFVTILLLIGLGIVAVCVINYVNVITAKASERAKEVGVRKALGAGRWELITQFTIETIAFYCLAALSSWILAFICLQSFREVFGIDPTQLYALPVIVSYVSAGFAIGTLASVYPAIRLMRTGVPGALRDLTASNNFSVRFKSVIVTMQIIISVTLLAFGFVVIRHVDYLQNKSLGYQRENLLYFVKPDDISFDEWISFEENLQQQASITTLGGSFYPLLSSMNKAQLDFKGEKFTAAWNTVNPNFVEAMQMEIVEGRDFDTSFPGDSSAVVINEAARAAIESQAILGETISFWRGEFQVIGVVKNFHFQPFNQPFQPVVFVLSKSPPKIIYARTKAMSQLDAVKMAQGVMKSSGLTRNIDVTFFDDAFTNLVKNELRMRTLVISFAAISLFVTTVAIFALIKATSNRYRRQVCIRKVLGASSRDILLIFAKSLGVIIITGYVLSFPVILWAIDRWLAHFADKPPVAMLDLAVAYVTISILTLLVIGKQLSESIVEDPVKVLREQ